MSNEDMCEHTPEVRTQMYRELAEQKESDEERKREMQPRDRDYDQEHEISVKVLHRKMYTILGLYL
jgi:hypothetical protein